MQNYPCSLQFSWSVGVCPLLTRNTEIHPWAWSIPSWSKSDLLGIYLEVKFLRIWLTATYTLLISSCSKLIVNPMSYSAGSNVCLCLLLLAFSLANLGDSYSPAWERAEQPGEPVRRGGLRYSLCIQCWHWSFLCHLWIKHLPGCLPFRYLGNLPCPSPLLGVLLGDDHPCHSPLGNSWAEGQEGLHQISICYTDSRRTIRFIKAGIYLWG